MTDLSVAFEYVERGWSVIPIRPDTKKPCVSWKEFQDRQPTEEEIGGWCARWPSAYVALITGALSGIVAVDCDSPQAIQFCRSSGIWSPVRVRTPRGGLHLYFRHPRDGTWRGPRVGSNSTGIDWPQFPGLDFRGDGSYPLLPPSKDYIWEVDPGFSLDDTSDWPVWSGWPMAQPPDLPSFDALDLSAAHVTDGNRRTEWERTREYVEANFPSTLRIPTGQGNGRNERVMRYASDLLLEGFIGDRLADKLCQFMDEFFVERLPDREWLATVRSMTAAELRNHPERWITLPDGDILPATGHPEPETIAAPSISRLIHMDDADILIGQSASIEYLLEPFLPRASILQIAGYSGHGKSTFIGHALAAAAAGRSHFGPFFIPRAVRTLYLDYEQGRGTIGRRLKDFELHHGSTGDRFSIWAPFIENDDLPLWEEKSLRHLESLIRLSQPDVVVIDTVRSAYPGIEENKAESWTALNRLCVSLRNAGLAVIVLHHRNKPSQEGGPGTEAGSTAQLTVLETQLRITQVFEDATVAKDKSGLFDGNYDNPIFPRLRGKMTTDERLNLVLEVRYGKVREWTDLHDTVQWIGFAEDLQTGMKRIVSSTSARQRAMDLFTKGYQPDEIARALMRPLAVVRSWLAP